MLEVLSVLSGSLDVLARLKSADDLELLIRVLEANKVLFATDQITTRNFGQALGIVSGSIREGKAGPTNNE
jgi:hypothetical protein